MPRQPPRNSSRHKSARRRDASKPHAPAERVSDPRIGRTLPLKVERIVPGGLGMAHAEDMTFFVALAAPGDKVEARIESVRDRVCFARILRVIEPSPVRVEPLCPYFGGEARCGGCDFQQLSYDAQLAAKLDIIRDALRRTARIEPPPSLAITPAPRPWAYRSRAEWQHDPTLARLGYYRRGTHEIVDVKTCPVLAPELERTLITLRDAMVSGASPPDTREFRAMAGDDGRIALTPHLDGFSHGGEAQPAAGHDLASDELLRTIHGETYRYNADCFFQINHDLLPDLIAEALRPLDASSSAPIAAYDLALDLYCGVGLFTVPLARRFARVIGVEGHPTSAAYARRNIEAARLGSTEIVTADVRRWLAGHKPDLPAPDFVLLDPPRAGAETETVNNLIELHPRRIAYVSCDPVTLARDLKMLVAHNYELESIRAFDLFPQTHHVETVAHLVRQDDPNNTRRCELTQDAANMNTRRCE